MQIHLEIFNNMVLVGIVHCQLRFVHYRYLLQLTFHKRISLNSLGR